MANTQNPYSPAVDWSSEISGGQMAPAMGGPGASGQMMPGQTGTGQPAATAQPAVQTPPVEAVTAAQTMPGQMVQGPAAHTQTGMTTQTMTQTMTQTAPAGAAGWLKCSSGSPAGTGSGGGAGSITGIGSTSSTTLDLRNRTPRDIIEAPTTVAEAHAGSLKVILGQNLGNYVAATLLIGTQGTTTWEGVLYDVGNDYLIIYQTGRDRYIVCDIYSLKYIEFYDNRRRELCENILRQNGWQETT